jgi:uncharacterized Ntn-hydrolase superfamily protein
MFRGAPPNASLAAAAVVAAVVLAANGALADQGTTGPRDVSPARASSALRAAKTAGPTFAIVAYDSATSSWGVACASARPASGARVLYAAAGMGAIAAVGGTGETAVRAAFLALARGGTPEAALDSARLSPGAAEARQLALVAPDGRAAAATGSHAIGWAGHRVGTRVASVGDALEGAETLDAMMAAFQARSGDLGARLMAALEAGDRPAPGGSALEAGNGFASAAILVVRAGGGPLGESDRLTDLRIDAAPDPIAALKALYVRHSETYLAAAHVRFGDEARRRGDDVSANREYAEGEVGFRAAVARAPKDADALNELAWFLALHGSDAAEAVRFAEAAVAARADDPNLWDTLAEAAYRSGSLDRAIEAAQRAARLDKENARYGERLRAFRAAKDALLGSEKGAPKESGTPAR